MEYRQLGGMRIPILSFGTGTFGGKSEFFKAWGSPYWHQRQFPMLNAAPKLY